MSSIPRPQTVKNKVPSTELSAGDSLRLAKGKFCSNHPWRHAYAVCNVCKLPYCFIDIMEDNGKLYCLNDINLALEASGSSNSAINSFSIFSSVIFLANSALLGYFMYPQAKFFVLSLIAIGSVPNLVYALLHITSSYYIPLGNMAVAVLGIVAAITVFRRSIYGFGFSLLVAFCGLLLILYEYLNSSTTYLFVSSILLLVSLAALTYSRMSSAKEVVDSKVLAADIDWPKPETF